MKKIIMAGGIIFALIISAAVFFANFAKEYKRSAFTISNDAKDSTITQHEEKNSDLSKKIAGAWQRTDSNYALIIEIEPTSPNKIIAKYYNPRPINVSKAELTTDDGDLKILIELQDEGYPGCAYKLRYNKVNDSLCGNYFQAAMGQNFSIEFARMKNE